MLSGITLVLASFFAAPYVQLQQEAPAAAAAPAAAPSGYPDVDGEWVNVNSSTRGIRRLTISGLEIHAYGSCRPTDCDFGVLKAKWHNPTKESANLPFLNALRLTQFSEEALQIYQLSDGHLCIRRQVRFTDHRNQRPEGPSNGTRVDIFQLVKPTVPPAPAP